VTDVGAGQARQTGQAGQAGQARQTGETGETRQAGQLEAVAIPAPDGVVLRGDLHGPEAPGVLVVLSHAMMADRRSLDRPRGAGLLTRLLEAGAAVLRMDARGHGESEGRAWFYDDLVDDTAVLADWAAERFPGAQRVAVGHSMFGHVALAHQARHGSFDRLALLGVQVWLRRTEPDPRRRLLKTVLARAARTGLALLPETGGVPVRRLGIGSDDESVRFLRQVFDWHLSDDWADRAGRSWSDALPGVTAPVLSIAGAADRLLSPPASQERFVRLTGGPVIHEVVGRATGLQFDPGHMELVLDPRMDPVWRRVARFAVHGT
jgi:predicted alpha/beta hydrolase